MLLAFPPDFTAETDPLMVALKEKHLAIHSSRCGNFKAALYLMQQNPELYLALSREVITHHFSLEQINEAFEVARNSSECIKAVIHIGE